ncbi:MAG: hypothetical protein A2166_02950 [Omnitrophica WOR_2 bacterium RBG_13_41_10]|nr:MAG: hypothetical protein A2166_02950 [Omnitrophica WOR_2 bacterium RBG_13_41_10]
MKPIFNRGFTLVEIVVAVAILAFALCSILLTYITCFVLMTTSKNINIATNEAMGLMEGIRGAAFTELERTGLPCNPLDGHYNGCNFPVASLPSGTSAIVISGADLDGNGNDESLNVTVTVTWNQSGRIMNTALVTLVANR